MGSLNRRLRKRERENADAEDRTEECGIHGRQPWRGTIRCENCRRIFFDNEDGNIEPKDRLAPEKCRCGVRLLPNDTLKGGHFSGFPYCELCADEDRADAAAKAKARAEARARGEEVPDEDEDDLTTTRD